VVADDGPVNNTAPCARAAAAALPPPPLPVDATAPSSRFLPLAPNTGAMTVSSMLQSAPSIVATQFSNERGHGLGPTAEFYTLMCREIARPAFATAVAVNPAAAAASSAVHVDLDAPAPGSHVGRLDHASVAAMWLSGLPTASSSSSSGGGGSGGAAAAAAAAEDGAASLAAPAPAASTLLLLHPFPQLLPLAGWVTPEGQLVGDAAAVPSPLQAAVLHRFEVTGRFVARGLRDGRLLDLPLSRPFIKALRGSLAADSDVGLADMLAVAPELARSVQSLDRMVAERDATLAALTAALATDAAGTGEAATEAAARVASLASAVAALCLDFSFPGCSALPLHVLPQVAAVAADERHAAYPPAVAAALQLAAAVAATTGVHVHDIARATAARGAGGSGAAAVGRAPARLVALPLPDGAAVDVTAANLHVYVAAMLRTYLLDGLAPAVAAFQRGFAYFAPAGTAALALLTVSEVSSLLCGAAPGQDAALWTREALAGAVVAGHGYTMGSPQVTTLLEVLSELTPKERRLFLRFVTGAPRLPDGGFAALSPRLTIVRATVDNPDAALPTCSTCQVYLKLPPYSSKAALRSRLLLAITEGQDAFSFD